MRASRFARSFLVSLPFVLVSNGVAQTDQWLRGLVAKKPVTREIARRHLALLADLPAAELKALLKSKRPEVVLAAVSLLRDRKQEIAALRQISLHYNPVIRRALLPVASDDTVKKTLAEGPNELRPLALLELEDRKLLDDELLVKALRSDVEDLAEVACRLVVFERSPFPIAIAEKLADAPKAKLRLITWLADRPRTQSGPWLERILAKDELTEMERVLAINSLPSERILHKLALLVMDAAASSDVAISNRAGYAAARFEPRIADKLIAEFEIRVRAGTPVSALLPCLERISTNGEGILLQQALRSASTVRADIFHWLSSRESKLVNEYVARALDSAKPFPKELIRLAGTVLTTPKRIARIVDFLADGERVSVNAFSTLIEAEVYHPTMLEFAVNEGIVGEGRRLWHLLKLPLAKLPLEVFVETLEAGDFIACSYAVNSLARGRIPKKLEPMILEYAESSVHVQLQASSARALILWGTEAAGRKAWVAMRKGDHTALAIRWLMEKPKPWCYEILLKERERLTTHRTKENRSSLHRILIALAKLGDRGANDELVREIPRLAPEEMRQVQKLMDRFLKTADLAKLARKYLHVQEGDPDERTEREGDLGEERRVELLEWFLARKDLDLGSLLAELWTKDGSYEVRLVALRGLLARDSEKLHGQIYKLLAKPYGHDQQDLAFEIVGGGLGDPITAKGLELLAHVVLRAPLTNPKQEIQYSIDQTFGSARGAYPVLTPAANLLRRDEHVKPRAAFEKVAAQITTRRFVLNRQRLGLFLIGIARRDELLDELGPVIARLILAAPDLSTEFVGPAQMLLADEAETAGDYEKAAGLYAAASRAWSREVVPLQIRRALLGAVDPVARYHPIAALAARAPMCRARASIADGQMAKAKRQLLRARDLAEGDNETIKQIAILRKATNR